jgi:molybdopterin-guanine dinucleotide biosynthesis protein A
MLEVCEGYDVVVPVLKGELQPLHAIYSKRCIGPIQDMVAQGVFRIYDFFPQVATLRLEEAAWRAADPEHRSFANINTQEELMRAERLLEGTG